MRRIVEIVALVALARLLALLVNELTADAEFTRFVHFVYLPAGVAVVSLIVFGYWSAVGVALSAFIWNALYNDLDLHDSILFTVARYAACVLSLALFNLAARRWPTLDLRQLTLTSVLAFVTLHSLVNPAIHHLAFYLEGELVQPTLESLAWMFIGDVTGSLVVFLLGSLAMSSWLRAKRSGTL